MKAFRKLLTRAAVLSVGCALGVPAAAAAAASPNQPVTVTRPAIQLGVDVDLYAWAGLNYDQASAAEVAYIKALHANSVMVSFPFFVASRKSTTIYTKPSTPTPADLAQFAQVAENAGIYVTLRPLMSLILP